MRKQGLYYQYNLRTSKYSSYLGDVGKIAPDRIHRKFSASQPMIKLTTDITEIVCKNNTKLYLSPFYDLFNNEVIAFSISSSPSHKFVHMGAKIAMEEANKNGHQCIVHSDQGSHYQVSYYTDLFRLFPNLKQSMSRKGNSLDNGAMESFFGRLKDMLFYLGDFKSVPYDVMEKHLIKAIHYYNNDRPQRELDGLSPVEYKNSWLKHQLDGSQTQLKA